MFSLELVLHDNEIIDTDIMKVGTVCVVSWGASGWTISRLPNAEQNISVIRWHFDPGAFSVDTELFQRLSGTWVAALAMIRVSSPGSGGRVEATFARMVDTGKSMSSSMPLESKSSSPALGWVRD